MKILIIRFSSIGDILLTFHVIHALREKHPEAEFFFLTKGSFFPLFNLFPIKINLVPLNPSIFKTAKTLRKEKFDLIIDLHHNLRSQLLRILMLNHSWSHVQKLNFKKWLFTTFKWDHLPHKHVVDRYLYAAGLAGPSKTPLLLNTTERKVVPFEKPYLAWVLGAKFKTKQYPIQKIKAVLSTLNHPIVLLGGTSELEEAKPIISNESVLNLVGKTTIDEAATVLKNASLVVTNDTGLMHLAAFYNNPMIVLWGSTTPAFGMGPYACNQVFHKEVEGLSCRPCSKIGYQTCPKKHFNCMNLHDISGLVTQINSIFDQEN